MTAGLLLNGVVQGQTTSGMVPVDITGRFGSATPVTLFSAPNAAYEARFLVPVDSGNSAANFRNGAFSFALNGTAVNATTAYFSEQDDQLSGPGLGNGNGRKASIDFTVGKGDAGSAGFIGTDFYLSGPGWLAAPHAFLQPSDLIPGVYTMAGFKGDPNRAYVRAPGLGSGYPPGVSASLSSNQITIGTPVPEPSTLSLLGLGGFAFVMGTVLRERVVGRKPGPSTSAIPDLPRKDC